VEVLEKMRPRRHGGEVADSRKNIVRHYHGWGSRGINLSARNDSPKSGGRRKRGADGGGGVVRMGRALVRASGKSHLDPFEPTWRGHARDQDSRARKKRRGHDDGAGEGGAKRCVLPPSSRRARSRWWSSAGSTVGCCSSSQTLLNHGKYQG